MQNSIKLVGALVVAAVIGSSGAAFAAPAFTDTTQSASDVSAQLGYFKSSDIDALAHAKQVNVVNFNGWSLDSDDNPNGGTKGSLADTFSPQIGQTQGAIASDPAALKVLHQGGISLGDVAGVNAGKNGDVTVYVD
jgi:hypothetical protein